MNVEYTKNIERLAKEIVSTYHAAGALQCYWCAITVSLPTQFLVL
jgi:hypothetical protein